jgi:hypothetical protein
VTRLGAGLLGVVLLLSGCGVRPTGVVYAGEGPVATAPASPTAQVYFLWKEQPVPVTREVSPWGAQQVFDSLLLGPTRQERARGLRTEIPGIKQITVRDLGDRVIYVDTVPHMVKLPPAAYAQLYCTGAMLAERPIVRVGTLEPYPPPGCLGADATGKPAQPSPYRP